MDQSIRIGLTGDVMTGRNVNAAITANGFTYPWGNLLPLMQTTDLNLINLEAALTNSRKKVFKTFNFKASPGVVATLKAACITVVNLANNHILDFSEEGLIETIQTLQKAGIQFVGAGRNERQAAKPVILVVKGIRTGVLGFTDNEPGWQASGSGSGTNYINVSDSRHRERVRKEISELRAKVDLLVVSFHWGPNLKESPDPEFIDFAHEMTRAGADLIYGHSAHNFQGIERCGNQFILYDTGDFVDDYMVHPTLKNDHSFFFVAEADKQGIRHVRLYPVVISRCQVNLAAGKDYQWCFERLQQLSLPLGTKPTDLGEVIVV